MIMGCARSGIQVRWDEAFAEARDAVAAGAAPRTVLEPLVRRAPRPVDEGHARFAIVEGLVDAGDELGAVRALTEIGRDASRRDDRGRALYHLARLAEARGQRDAARQIYRRLMLVYPDRMPGERANAHLERMSRADGPAAVESHLRFTKRAYGRLATTQIGDNLAFFPAAIAHERFVTTGSPRWARLARELYGRVIRDHRNGGMWNDALWELSRLHHATGDFDDEIAAIRAIQRTREKLSLFGHDEHTYFWRGQLRIARVQLLQKGQPRAAAASYQAFIDRYVESIWLDDAYFWQGCAYLRAGDTERADASFDGIAKAYSESKYLRRVDRAKAEPMGAICVPPDFGSEAGR